MCHESPHSSFAKREMMPWMPFFLGSAAGRHESSPLRLPARCRCIFSHTQMRDTSSCHHQHHQHHHPPQPPPPSLRVTGIAAEGCGAAGLESPPGGDLAAILCRVARAHRGHPVEPPSSASTATNSCHSRRRPIKLYFGVLHCRPKLKRPKLKQAPPPPQTMRDCFHARGARLRRSRCGSR